MAEEKLDLIKAHRAEYTKPKSPKRISIGPARYLAIDGRGAPGAAGFEEAIGALYGMAYTIKFQSKFAGRDFVVCKLETIWGEAGEDSSTLSDTPREEWPWQMMIRVPDFVANADLDRARAALAEKGKEGDFAAVRLEQMDEGECAQVVHVGPYETLSETIAELHAFIEAEGLARRDRQHDVYLNDPRRVPAERLQTIVRQPVA